MLAYIVMHYFVQNILIFKEFGVSTVILGQVHVYECNLVHEFAFFVFIHLFIYIFFLSCRSKATNDYYINIWNSPHVKKNNWISMNNS